MIKREVMVREPGQNRKGIGRETRIAFLAVGGILLVVGLIVGAVATGGLASAMDSNSSESGQVQSTSHAGESNTLSHSDIEAALSPTVESQEARTEIETESQLVNLPEDDVSIHENGTAEPEDDVIDDLMKSKLDLHFNEPLPAENHQITVWIVDEPFNIDIREYIRGTSRERINPEISMNAVASMRLANSSQVIIEIERYTPNNSVTVEILTIDTDQLFEQSGLSRTDVVEKRGLPQEYRQSD